MDSFYFEISNPVNRTLKATGVGAVGLGIAVALDAKVYVSSDEIPVITRVTQPGTHGVAG